MTHRERTNTPVAGHGNQWLTAMASVAVGAAFFGLWFWLLPQWLGFSVAAAEGAGWRWLAAVPSALGFAVALRCVWDFGWTGRGTPVPIAPPHRLVAVGFYRHVRNPMYLGFAAGWIGLWIVFAYADSRLIAAVAAVALGVHLFVVFYEEPTLRRMFGSDYQEYCRNVGRWWPRVKAWEGAGEEDSSVDYRQEESQKPHTLKITKSGLEKIFILTNTPKETEAGRIDSAC